VNKHVGQDEFLRYRDMVKAKAEHLNNLAKPEGVNFKPKHTGYKRVGK
jgi:hypothetical protein